MAAWRRRQSRESGSVFPSAAGSPGGLGAVVVPRRNYDEDPTLGVWRSASDDAMFFALLVFGW